MSKRHKIKSILTTLSLTIFFQVALADDSGRQAYVIELQNQVPETIIPTIKPLLSDGDGISGFNNELVITTDTQRITTIRELVKQLDKPLRNLLISVKNNNSGSSQDSNNGLSGGIRQGKFSVNTGEPIPEQTDGMTIRSNGLAYSTSSTQRTFSTQAEQQIRAVEGSPAFIYTGESRQFPNQNSSGQNQYGDVTSSEVDANKGFYVTARMTGDHVLLDISVSNDGFDKSSDHSGQSTINTQHLTTTVSGRMGEWISLGGIQLGERNHEDSSVKKITASANSLGDISVKINPLD